MYGYGYPMARPMRTPDGLKWSTVAFILYMVSMVLQLAFALLVASLIGSTAPDVQAIFATVVVVGIASFILSILVLVFFSIGFGYMYGGRNEFGPAHAKDVTRALWLFIIAILLGVAQIVATIFVIFSIGLGGGPAVVGVIYAAVGISIGFGTAIAVVVGVLLVLAVRHLADPQHTTLLYAAAFLGSITPGVIGALTLWQLGRVLPAIGGGAAEIDASIGIPTAVGSGLGMLTFALFLVVYRRAAARIRSGELRPVLPPEMPFAWPAVPAIAPPPGPPPQAPPQQPPALP